MTVSSSAIKHFNNTIYKYETDEKTFKEDIDDNNFSLDQLSEKSQTS